MRGKFIKTLIISGRAHHKLGRELLCLDSFAQIQLKGIYDGPELERKFQKAIAKHQTNYIPYIGQPYKLTHADKLVLDVKVTMEQKYGKNELHHILPHYQRPDIVCCFDSTGKSVTDKIIDCFPKPYRGKILSKEYILSQHPDFADRMNEFEMVAVVLGGWNFYIRDTRKPTGGLRLKMEQLELIGYKTILIHFDDWVNQPFEVKEKLIESEIQRVLRPSDAGESERILN